MSSRPIPSSIDHGTTINMRVLIMCLVISSTTLLFLFLLVSLVYLWFLRFKSSKTAPCDSISTAATNVAEATYTPALRPFSYREIRRMTDCFHPRNELGRGGSGIVFRGRLRDGKSVAVKKLELSSLQVEREYKNEIQILGSLRSPNIVSLLGYCSDPSRRALVYEFMPNGSLQEALFSGGKTLQWNDRYKIILDIAQALCFLHHDCSPPVIHGDIKPSNVLLGSDLDAKLADFGISRVRMEEDTGIEFFSHGLWKSQEVEKSSQLNSETDFGFPQSTTRTDSDNLSLKGKEVSRGPDNCTSNHSKEVGMVDLEAQVGGDWWWRQKDGSELESRDYVMEWIGNQIYGSGHVENSADEAVGNSIVGMEPRQESPCQEVRKVKKRKMKEWWKEEYFMEIRVKRNTFRKIEDKLKRLSSARRLWWRRHDFDRRESCNVVHNGSCFRRSWRRKKNPSSQCQEMWSGDLFSKELSSTTSMRGTVCYVAPEYGGCGYLMEKGDVYSFGVLVLVVVSGRRPLHISSSPMDLQKANLICWARQLAQTGNMVDLVDESLKNEYNTAEAVLCINLALLCLQRTPGLRPNSYEIVRILSGELELQSLRVEFSLPSTMGKTFNNLHRKTVAAAD